MNRDGYIRQYVATYMSGYEYIVVWNCEFDIMLVDDPVMRNFCDNFELTIITPRSYFYG